MRTAIIGAGAAGMMAAAAAGSDEIVLFEQNEKFGKKVYITGKGRCNITNNIDTSEFIEQINRNPYFCYSALYTFTNKDMMEFLESKGLPIKIERGNRVFPASDKSSDVIKTIEKFVREKHVSVRLNTQVKDIRRSDELFEITFDGTKELFDRCIIATGGLSYPSTGSTGFGLKIAEKMGHNIITPVPSLVPIRTAEKWVAQLKGLSLRNITLSYKSRGKNISYFGDLLFNEDGITGPTALKMSTHGKDFKEGDLFFIDLKPALSKEQLEKRILRDFSLYLNKEIQNGLSDLLPKRLILPILSLCSIDLEKKIHQITKQEREKIIQNIKGVPLTFIELRSFKEAIITNGGIDTSEIDPSTMESKIIKGLYFAGEIVDIDAMTGGFNLQLAFSTGYLAGISSGADNGK